MEFLEKSYRSHENEEPFKSENFETMSVNENHEFRRVLPVIRHFPESSWITLGDGRYGCDAHYLQNKSRGRVVATDINSKGLEIAKQKGFINEYSRENAEKLSFKDNEFDFTACLNSYHHFPRADIAFYEMLRVSKIGVVLIEPVEFRPRILDRLKYIVKKMIRKDKSSEYEISGNYIYRVSIRDLERKLQALNLPAIAYQNFNTFYAGDLQGWKKKAEGLINRLGLFIQDFFCFFGLLNYGSACVICFKTRPDAQLLKNLKKAGFKTRILPENPFIKS